MRSPSVLILHEEAGVAPRRQTRSPSVLILEQLPAHRGGPDAPPHTLRRPPRKNPRAHPAAPRPIPSQRIPRRRGYPEHSPTPMLEPPPLTIFPEEAPDLEVFPSSTNAAPSRTPSYRAGQSSLLGRESRSPAAIPPLFPGQSPFRQQPTSLHLPLAKRAKTTSGRPNDIGRPEVSRQRGGPRRGPSPASLPGGPPYRAGAMPSAGAGLQSSSLHRLMDLNLPQNIGRKNYMRK